MMQFDATLVAQVLNFLFLFAILNAVLFRPVYRAIEERRRYLSDGQKMLGNTLARIQEMQRQYQQMIDGSRQQAQTRINRTIQEADKLRQEQVQQVLSEGRQQLEVALAGLRDEREQALKQLGGEIVTLAEQIVQKILAPVRRRRTDTAVPSLRPAEPAGEV